MAMMEAGTVTIMTSIKPMPLAPSISSEMIAAVAADTGDPVQPSDAAMVAMLNGRSGRTFSLRAISEMIGSNA